jgi:hypothetical protein
MMHNRPDLPAIAEVDSALAALTRELQARYPSAPRYAIARRIARRAMRAAGACSTDRQGVSEGRQRAPLAGATLEIRSHRGRGSN